MKPKYHVKSKKILYLAFCRLEKHFRFYIVGTNRDVIQKLYFQINLTFLEIHYTKMENFDA